LARLLCWQERSLFMLGAAKYLSLRFIKLNFRNLRGVIELAPLLLCRESPVEPRVPLV
jgi:hypothetical protein